MRPRFYQDGRSYAKVLTTFEGTSELDYFTLVSTRMEFFLHESEQKHILNSPSIKRSWEMSFHDEAFARLLSDRRS